MALAGRIYVEGRHDAELVEQVWGHDLRVEGVVVEYLGGIDDLSGIVSEFRPRPGRLPGAPVDHLVDGSKESRIAEAVRRGPGGEHTLVVGHPYVDIWQAVKPARVGLDAWPTILAQRRAEGQGICDALGWPHRNQADIAAAWQRIRGTVRDWNDLEPAPHRPGRGTHRLCDPGGLSAGGLGAGDGRLRLPPGRLREPVARSAAPRSVR